MTRFVVSFAVLTFLVVFIAIVNAITPPPGPSSFFLFCCPNEDNAGVLNTATIRQIGGGYLFCGYGPMVDHIPNDWEDNCEYSLSTGMPFLDGNSASCPGSAISCASTKRDRVVKKRAENTAAQPRTSRPQFMAVRYTFDKKNRAQRVVE